MVKRLYVEAVRENTGLVSDDHFILQVRGERLDGRLGVSIVLPGANTSLDDVDSVAQTFRGMLSDQLGEPVALRLKIIPIDIMHYEALPTER